LPGCGEAVQPWHPDVHENDVRAQRGSSGHRLRAVARLTHDLDVAFGFEDEPQPGADHGLVVDEQHPDRHPPTPCGSGKVTRTV
jgi:hypothetical protein